MNLLKFQEALAMSLEPRGFDEDKEQAQKTFGNIICEEDYPFEFAFLTYHVSHRKAEILNNEQRDALFSILADIRLKLDSGSEGKQFNVRMFNALSEAAGSEEAAF